MNSAEETAGSRSLEPSRAVVSAKKQAAPSEQHRASRRRFWLRLGVLFLATLLCAVLGALYPLLARGDQRWGF